MTTTATILIVPGLRDHVADHWQTLLATKLTATRSVHTVPPLGRSDLSCARRVDAIQRTLSEIDGPVIAVAHSAGCIMLAHWAQQYRRDRIIGAVLATPADLDTPMPAGYPTFHDLDVNGWLPVPRVALPFPSIVASSSNDPLATPEAIEQLAQAWGSQHVPLGAVGHLNPSSGFGEWPQAEALIALLEKAS